MKKHPLNSASNGHRQFGAFGALSLAVAGLTGIMSLSRATFAQPYQGSIRENPIGFFQPFFGNIYPLLGIILVAVVGVASLGFLRARGWFEIYPTRGILPGLVFSATVATLFGIEVVFAEITNIIRMPADLNVPPPYSLLFYPVIAYVAEVLFHALPLALLLLVLGTLFKKLDTNRLVWICVLIVASLEPIFQVRTGLSEQPFSWADAYVGLHVFAINLLQLYVFRRYGFISMYSLRLVYYLYWHIIWGYLRLQLLF